MTRASVRRVLGPIAMAIGLIGLVLSLLLIPFAWIVRAPAVDALDSAVARVDDAADRARSVSNELADRVAAAQASAASVAAAADALLAGPPADDAALNGFAGIVEQRLIQPIGQVRQRLTSVRVALTTAAAVRDSLGAVLPGAAPSDESVTGLSALAGRLEAVDAALGSASERLAVAAGVPRTVAIGAARAAASRVATALDTAGQAIAQVQQTVDTARARLSDARDRAVTTTTLGAGALTIIGLYLAGLHLALIAQGRRLRQAAPPAPEPAPSPVAA